MPSPRSILILVAPILFGLGVFIGQHWGVLQRESLSHWQLEQAERDQARRTNVQAEQCERAATDVERDHTRNPSRSTLRSLAKTYRRAAEEHERKAAEHARLKKRFERRWW